MGTQRATPEVATAQATGPPAPASWRKVDMVQTETPPPTGATRSTRRFGTFLGVFTPSVLTILGVMMYLRFGWVVGNTGLPVALLIVLMSSAITLVTGLSASAISTNMKVGVGGEYYMVSRSIGLELGGAIGIPLFMCRTLSLTLYAFGLAESVAFLWPASWGEAPITWMAAGIILAITAIAGRSAELTLKLQIPIMIAVGLSLVALVGGVLEGGFTTPEWVPHYERSAAGGFWYVFAVFFPAVTGFAVGIGMSGDLRDPQRSIPKGTIWAVGTGTVVYVAIVVLLSVSAKVTGDDLARLDPNAPPVWTKIALFGVWLIYPGMWGAILSSAFGSALGGPRVLQALAADGIAPRFLSRTSRDGQPTVATWVSGAIALAAVALGDLNAVGRWVTIFFLTLYVTMNMVAAIEGLVGDPSYRPTIRVPWWLSMAGAVGAIAVMFLISPLACLGAVGLEVLLYGYLRRRSLEASWGDVRAGLWIAVARFALLQLRKVTRKARNWRPHILLFTANPASRIGLVQMANWFQQNRGVVTVCQVVEGDLRTGADYAVDERREAMERALDEAGLTAFSEVSIVPDFETGIVGIVQANGFAGLQSNTVMFGWPSTSAGLARVLGLVRTMSHLHMSTILVKLPDGHMVPEGRARVDVWWRGRQHNGDLMLLLAHLLTMNPEWRQAAVRVRSVVESQDQVPDMTRRLEKMIRDARIRAVPDVLVPGGFESTGEFIRVESRGADVVFLGLKVPAPGEEEALAGRLMDMAGDHNVTIFVRNAGPFAGELL